MSLLQSIETDQSFAAIPISAAIPTSAEPEHPSLLRRAVARVSQVRHALSLWTGRSPAGEPGHLELAVTPLVRSWLTIAPLILSDLLALVIATLLSFCIMRLFGPVAVRGIHQIMPIMSATLVLGFLSSGLYSIVGVNPVVELRQFTRLTTLVFIVALSASYIVDARSEWRLFFLLEWLISLPLLPILRSIIRPRCAAMAWWGQPALVFGNPAEAATLALSILSQPACGIRPIAIVADDDSRSINFKHLADELPILDHALAQHLVRRSRLSYGIILDSSNPSYRQAAVARAMSVPLSHVLVMSSKGDLPTLWRDTCECAGMPAVEVQNRLIMPWPRLVKRTSDLLLTIAGGIVISPLLLAIAIAVKLTSRGPIFFGHTRIGKCGQTFKAWKFRTMVQNAPTILAQYLAENPSLRAEWEQDHKLKNDPRVTPLGRFLRKTSLDEFPQLWNVIRGEMSLVGPRPIVDEEIEKYGLIFDKYMQVRPGITGMWQVSGRNNTSYAERISFDDYYVRNWSPWLDLHLLTRTVYSLVERKGAY